MARMRGRKNRRQGKKASDHQASRGFSLAPGAAVDVRGVSGSVEHLFHMESGAFVMASDVRHHPSAEGERPWMHVEDARIGGATLRNVGFEGFGTAVQIGGEAADPTTEVRQERFRGKSTASFPDHPWRYQEGMRREQQEFVRAAGYAVSAAGRAVLGDAAIVASGLGRDVTVPRRLCRN